MKYQASLMDLCEALTVNRSFVCYSGGLPLIIVLHCTIVIIIIYIELISVTVIFVLMLSSLRHISILYT